MFRPAIRPIFLAISAVAMPIFLLLVLLDDGLHPDWIALFAATTGLALFAIVSAWTFHFLFPDGISAEGISGHSFWGLRRFVPWDHIAAARPIRILNLRYLRLYSTIDRKVTWIALFPAEPDAFHSALYSAIPPNNPVSAHFNKA